MGHCAFRSTSVLLVAHPNLHVLLKLTMDWSKIHLSNQVFLVLILNILTLDNGPNLPLVREYPLSVTGINR